MDENLTQAIEAARQELAIVKVEIAALKARKSIIECIREAYSKEPPKEVRKKKVRRRGLGSKEPPQVEVTILESEYLNLIERARSSEWIERKIAELKQLGDNLWRQVNRTGALQATIRRAEEAEYRCRCLENEIDQLLNPPAQEYVLDDDGDREIDYPEMDDREH